ncbi:MAG: hypothetical protein A3K03_07405 [Bdellovibrionales bacterium RIFOXYD1_FULL_44_7]|nr:MAG: hypothetical protein A3K03_07405 [Bdellovibrionales bacterium RIFOXYD1_FULL_44_7]
MRVNSAIQVSIVNQQYARQHAHFLSFNSPVYPELRWRERFFVDTGVNRMVAGVSENARQEEEETYSPDAPTQMITRTKQKSGGEGPAGSEPDVRGIVRIRSTVALCTQSNVIAGENSFVPLNSQTLREGITPRGFLYCRSPLDEEVKQ